LLGSTIFGNKLTYHKRTVLKKLKTEKKMKQKNKTKKPKTERLIKNAEKATSKLYTKQKGGRER